MVSGCVLHPHLSGSLAEGTAPQRSIPGLQAQGEQVATWQITHKVLQLLLRWQAVHFHSRSTGQSRSVSKTDVSESIVQPSKREGLRGRGRKYLWTRAWPMTSLSARWVYDNIGLGWEPEPSVGWFQCTHMAVFPLCSVLFSWIGCQHV